MAELARVFIPENNVVEFPNTPTPQKKPSNKKAGVKSEVYSFEVEDMKKIHNYFKDNEKWIHLLAFTISCNMARRAGDMLELRWKHFFNPDGKFRNDLLEIKEEKTDKYANPHINQAIRDVISLYIEKTGCNPADNGYENYVFTQLSGNFRGRLLSYSGYLKALKKVAKEVGVEYNVGTHSARKSLGRYVKQLNSTDANVMETLQTMFNHSDTKTTNNYIGITKKTMDGYYDDMGDFFSSYIVGDKEYIDNSGSPVLTIETADLREIISMAYQMGISNAGSTDPMTHINAINDLNEKIEAMKK